jgi:iron(III) transport system substrate-binding protein
VVDFKTRGAPIDWTILDPYYAKPNMLMLARHAPHPHAAALLIDWTLSEEGQSLLAGLGYVVARKGVKQSVPALLEKESFLADPTLLVRSWKRPAETFAAYSQAVGRPRHRGNKLNGEAIKPLEHLER